MSMHVTRSHEAHCCVNEHVCHYKLIQIAGIREADRPTHYPLPTASQNNDTVLLPHHRRNGQGRETDAADGIKMENESRAGVNRKERRKGARKREGEVIGGNPTGRRGLKKIKICKKTLSPLLITVTAGVQPKPLHCVPAYP